MSLYDLDYDAALTKLNNDPDLTTVLNSMLAGTPSTTNVGETLNTNQLEYFLVPGYIKTNFRSGYLMVAYRAIPTDNMGYPMIPDDEAFIEALYWYINMKLKYIEWSNGRARDAIYYHAENKWHFYATRAYGKSMSIKTLDEMETIKSVWNRLLPNNNAHSTFYQYLSQAENIKHQ